MMNLTQLFMSPDDSNTLLALTLMSNMTSIEVFDGFKTLYNSLRELSYNGFNHFPNGVVGLNPSSTYEQAILQPVESPFLGDKPSVVICQNKFWIYYYPHESYKVSEDEIVFYTWTRLDNGEYHREYKSFFRSSIPEDFMEYYKQKLLT